MQQIVRQQLLAWLVAVERCLQLPPDLVRDLVARALLGRLGHKQARRVPVGDVDRDQPAHRAVAPPGAEQPAVTPELRLRDRGQRPWRVWVEDVPTNRRHVLVEKELDTDHPRHQVIDVRGI